MGWILGLFLTIIAYFFNKILNLAMMTQSKDYIKGSIIVSLIISVPTLFSSLGGRAFMDFFLPPITAFAVFWVLGFVIDLFFDVKERSKTKRFEHRGFAQGFLLPFILLWALFSSGGGVNGYSMPFFVLAMGASLFRAPVLAANVVVQSFFMFWGIGAFMNGAVVDEIDMLDSDVSDTIDPNVVTSTPDVSQVAMGSEGTQGLEHVDSHYREGTYVNDYTRADGTQVDGHWRDGGPVKEHTRVQ